MNGRILLVEGDGVLGAFVEEMLRRSGYEVIVVRTLIGEVERIDSVISVILDIDTTYAEQELDCLGGFLSYDESLPIVLTGLQVPDLLYRHLHPHLVLQAKHLAWVQKPFRNNEFLAAVRQAHKTHESSRP
ncbi:MAG: hypothetical protein ACREJN_15500 [Nitrospiraceae bacterium]